MGKKYLIINADDFGMCHSANEAVMDLFKGGWIKSSTIMAPAPGADEAIAFAAANPDYAIGVHLTHTNEWKERCPWGSLTGGKSLENEFGRMWPESEDFEAHCTYDEAIAEARAQIQKCVDGGMHPSHVDSHMGAMYGMNGKLKMLPKTLKMCGELGYPFRMFSKPLASQCPEEASMALFKIMCYYSGVFGKLFRVPMPDYLIFPEKIDKGASYEEFKKNFIDYLIQVPEGISETYVHPAMPTDEMKSIAGSWERRYWEYLVMKDPETHAAFKANGVHLISYRELTAFRLNK